MRFHSIAGLALIASATALVGCGDDASDGGGGAGSTTTSTTSGQGGGSTTSSTTSSSTGGDPTSCTEDGTFCARFVLPPEAVGDPTKLIIGFYAALPAAGPPDAVALNLPTPKATPAEPYAAKATDITITGSYRMLAVMFMPGGGNFQPKEGIDYDVASDPIEFTGAPIQGGDFVLKLHSADDGHL